MSQAERGGLLSPTTSFLARFTQRLQAEVRGRTNIQLPLRLDRGSRRAQGMLITKYTHCSLLHLPRRPKLRRKHAFSRVEAPVAEAVARAG
jgi:hypothetical protein